MTQDQERTDRVDTIARDYAAKSATAAFSISRPIGADSVSPALRKAFNDLGISEAGIEAYFLAKHEESRTGKKVPDLSAFVDQTPGTPSVQRVVALSARPA